MAEIRLKAASFAEDPDMPLLQRIAGQDEAALNELYQRYASALLAYLIGRLQDVRLAEEVLQDVLLAVWRTAPRFRGECRVRTWLLIIARSRAINAYHRQVSPALDVPLDELEFNKTAAAPADVEPAGMYHDLGAALQTLPAEQRETLELVFYHGLSLQETACVLKIAPGTVKSRLHRAKARLREWMSAESDPDERTY